MADVDHLTSTTAMELTTLPTSMVVLGAGYVGLEQAQLWAHLGVQVTVVGRFAPHTEPEVADVLRGVFADDGIAVVEERAVAVRSTPAGVALRTSSGGEVTGDRLLTAAGRVARTSGLGLQAAGVSTDEHGFIVVDTHQRTTNSRVFAAGDVAGAPQFVYIAAQTGHAAAAGALGVPTTVDYRGLPGVTFTTPQVASAGLTEAQALAAGHSCDCRVLDAHDIPLRLEEEPGQSHDQRQADEDHNYVDRGYRFCLQKRTMCLRREDTWIHVGQLRVGLQSVGHAGVPPHLGGHRATGHVHVGHLHVGLVRVVLVRVGELGVGLQCVGHGGVSAHVGHH